MRLEETLHQRENQVRTQHEVHSHLEEDMHNHDREVHDLELELAEVNGTREIVDKKHADTALEVKQLQHEVEVLNRDIAVV